MNEDGPHTVTEPYLRVGRYALFNELASGGMAKVHIGRLLGPVGFSRTVAIKRLHPTLSTDRAFVTMFVDEARLAARVRHPNVVPIIDVVQTEDELFLIMDYVQGETVARLMRSARRANHPIPLAIVGGIAVGVLRGLHAAHEARSDTGEPLNLVHRDVSPQNILVGIDGVPRVVDFGIAKASGRLQNTAQGQVKGKIAYMAPEHIAGDDVGREADIYSFGVVLWEMLAGSRLYSGETDVKLLARVLEGDIPRPSTRRPEIHYALDGVIMKALESDPELRYRSARDFAQAIAEVVPIATSEQIGAWVEQIAAPSLRRKEDLLAEVESHPGVFHDVTPATYDGSAPDTRRAPSTLSAVHNDRVPHSDERTLTSRESTGGHAIPSGSSWLRTLIAAVVVVGATGAVIALRPPDGSAHTLVRGLAFDVRLSAPAEPPSDAAAVDSSEPEPVDSAPTTKSGGRRPPPRPVSRWQRPQPPAPPPPAPVAQPAPQPAKPSCDPPFWIDDKGIQRLKPHCM
jgi:serine/threonine-protein kinase